MTKFFPYFYSAQPFKSGGAWLPLDIKIFIVMTLFSGQVMAQAVTDLDQTDVLTVFTQYGQTEYEKVPINAEYRITQTEGQWSFVTFAEPVVPVWASRDFLIEDAGVATISVNRLNLRTDANLQSHILDTGDRGYRSPVLQVENGFAKILAPTSVIFALRTADLENLNNAFAQPKNAGSIEGNPRSPIQSEAEDEVLGSSIDVDQQPARVAIESAASSDSAGAPKLEPPKSSRDSLHRLSPGDTISLRVFGEHDLSINNVRIPQSGTVSFPLIGSYAVVGKSVEELEDQLREVLSQGYVRNPRLSISIDSYRPIFVLGAAQRIGSFAYTEGLTIAKAIAVAGGAKNSAKKNGVSVLRAGQVIEDGLAINSTIEVRSGDIISIEEELGVDAEGGSYVYLHGEVRSPGEYKFRRGLTVEKAVVLAGGFTLRASRKRVSVSRIVEGQEAPAKLRKVALHMPIEPGDIIDVGASWF